jgi:hypothetical protein
MGGHVAAGVRVGESPRVLVGRLLAEVEKMGTAAEP